VDAALVPGARRRFVAGRRVVGLIEARSAN
jgi:hypothetical protein